MYVVAKRKNIDALVYRIFNLNDSLYYNGPDIFVYSDHDKFKEVNRVQMKGVDSCLLATPQ